MRLQSKHWRLIKRAGYLLSVGLLATALSGPEVRKSARGIEYLVIFDVTLSMATEDYAEAGFPRSRLDVAKERFRSVLPDLPRGSRLSLAGFAGNTVQIFLLSRPTPDVDAFEAGLSVLEWDNVWEVGSRLDQALRDIVAQSKGSRLFSVRGRRPVLSPPLNIFIFTDGGGSDVKDSVVGTATKWLLENTRVTFVGVGQPAASPVPEFKRSYPRDCLRDETGKCVTSRLNEGKLQALADWLEGRYERLGDAAQLKRLFLDEPLAGAATEVPQEVDWLFGAGSLAFFLLWVVI